MSASKLKLNPDKTEFILFGSKKKRERLNVCFPIDILGNPFTLPSQSGTWVFGLTLGLIFLSLNMFRMFVKVGLFNRGILEILGSSRLMMQLCRLPIVSSRLDYCNSLFRSLSNFNLHRLQSIQNSAARIVTNLSKFTQIAPVLRKLHWLPVQFHSQFKQATLVYKFIHTGFPKYFAPYLSTYHNTYNTRHSQSVANFLNVQKFQPKIHKFTKQFGFSFTFDAPTVWNSLLKTFVHHPLLPQNLSLCKGLSSLAHFCSFGFSVVPN